MNARGSNDMPQAKSRIPGFGPPADFGTSSATTALPTGNTQCLSPAAQTRAAATETAGEGQGLYCAGEVRILVLDDDESVCRVMQAALAPSGFRVDIVSDPARMAEALTAHTYQVVLLDYVIPGLEAGQLLEWVRTHQPDASIIAVTAYPSIDSALNCLRARTYDYLTKPFQIAHLQRTVMRCLESRGLLRLSADALRESLGSAIREQRKAQGLTLAQMAQRTGVSLGYLSQIELGKNSASIETLYRISLGLRVRISELFAGIQPSG